MCVFAIGKQGMAKKYFCKPETMFCRPKQCLARPPQTGNKGLEKNLIEFYVDGIEIGDNPIGRAAKRCPNVSFWYRKARNDQKKVPASRQPRKMAKHVKIGLNGSPSELLGRLLYQNAQFFEPYTHVIEILRQTP